MEEDRGRTRSLKGSRRPLQTELSHFVIVPWTLVAAARSLTVTQPAALHALSGLRHQDAFARLHCQLAPILPDFWIQALSVPAQPRKLPHENSPFP